MCGRIIQASGPLRLAIVDGLDVRDSRLTKVPRRYNGAPVSRRVSKPGNGDNPMLIEPVTVHAGVEPATLFRLN
jgi:hypothetical protein